MEKEESVSKYLAWDGHSRPINEKMATNQLTGLAPEIPEDLYHLIKKAVTIRKNLERSRKDKDSKFRLILVESRIHRLARYYKKTSFCSLRFLPPQWQTRDVVFHHLMNKDFPQHYVTWIMHGELNVLPNSRNTKVIQDAPPFENPIELLINEAFGGLRHECVDAEHMRWHAEDDSKDEILRHPRDGEAWKRLDINYPKFASDPQNVRLGLSTDGFNPFGTMSTKYSIWSVILFSYNLSPWLCMKQSNFILSMIIPGPRIVGNNIDVHLQPLIKELNELWSEGVDTFNSSKNKIFKIRAALMWTVSDFPGLDILSGWNMHTGLACPSCNFDTEPCHFAIVESGVLLATVDS
ncbi:40S ribosomal protein S13 [Capsicum annuum]|nr:40S ribosomal protein S13 [Capsicum annuum]